MQIDPFATKKILEACGINTKSDERLGVTGATLYLEPMQPTSLVINYILFEEATNLVADVVKEFELRSKQ